MPLFIQILLSAGHNISSRRLFKEKKKVVWYITCLSHGLSEKDYSETKSSRQQQIKQIQNDKMAAD